MLFKGIIPDRIHTTRSREANFILGPFNGAMMSERECRFCAIYNVRSKRDKAQRSFHSGARYIDGKK